VLTKLPTFPQKFGEDVLEEDVFEEDVDLPDFCAEAYAAFVLGPYIPYPVSTCSWVMCPF
jgi:hypothetical protein